MVFSYDRQKSAERLSVPVSYAARWQAQGKRPVRFNKLQHLMPKMAHTTFFNRLKQLVEEEPVIHTIDGNMPPMAKHSLSEIGRRFQTVLESIRVFGLEYITYMEQSER